MARQLFEEEIDLTNTSVNNTSTTTTVSRPQKFNGTAKVGTLSMGPQTRTIDEVGGRITTSDLLTQLRTDIAKLKDGKGTNEIRVSGKYPEVNYVIFDIPQLNSVQSISGNVYSGVIKKQFPVEELTPTDTSTSGTSGTSGISATSGTNGTVGTLGLVNTNFLQPFGEPGTPGEIREFPPTGQLYIWNFNYNVGRWNIYIPPSPPTGGINDGSNVGNVGFDQSGGGGPVGAGNNNLGGGNVTSGGGGPVGGGGGDGFIGGV